MLLNVKTTAATLLLLAMTGAPSLAQEPPSKPSPQPAPQPPPRWPDGTIGLGSTPGAEGYWQVRPGAGGGANPLNIPGPVTPKPDQVPFQPWARAVYQNRQKEAETNYPPTVRCKPAGGPAFWSSPGFDIVQVPGENKIYIINIAGPHSWRVVYMDGRPHPKDLRPSYLGHSVGRWEGDTLVIESVGFNEKTWIHGSYPTTKQLKIVERITRPALNLLTYRFTIDDPGAYTKPWDAGGWNNTRWLPKDEPFEYICQDDRF
jgi:hypothetical protein